MRIDRIGPTGTCRSNHEITENFFKVKKTTHTQKNPQKVQLLYALRLFLGQERTGGNLSAGMPLTIRCQKIESRRDVRFK